MDFANSLAIVTGGTGAIGGTVTQQFARADAFVGLPVRSEKHLTALPPNLQPFKQNLFLQRADLTSQSDTGDFVQSVIDRYGKIDYLVLAAGGYAGGARVEDVPLNQWEGQLSLNLTSAFLMSRAVLPHMRKSGFGRIITIAAMPASASGFSEISSLMA